MNERRVRKKRNDIKKATWTEIIISLLAVSILEIELLAGSSFCNDVIAIVRDPEFDLNLRSNSWSLSWVERTRRVSCEELDRSEKQCV